LNVKPIAVVGTGLIGRSWAITFARAGFEVRLWDPNPQASASAKDFVRSIARDLDAVDLLGGHSVEEVLARLTPCVDLGEALDGVMWVQECGPELIDIKRAVFATLDSLAPPEAILASSSSALLPSAISEGLPGRTRCVVAHPINPPYLVPAVELVPAPWTDKAVMERGAAFLREVGQVPLVMEREIDGFIMNRLQCALLDEAFRLVAGGYADANAVDLGIAEGLALRWSFMGPFETIDLNAPGGIADYVARYGAMYAGMSETMREPIDWSGPVLDSILASRRSSLPEQSLSERQIWRDRRLMALRAHKRKAEIDIGR